MINKYLAMGLGALIAVAPVVASVDAAQAATEKAMTSSGSHKSQMRHKSSMSKHHARSSAHHMHSMKKAPAMAPKS